MDVLCVVWRESSRDLERYGTALAQAWRQLPKARRGAAMLVANGATAVTRKAAENALGAATGREPSVRALPANRGFAHAANVAFASTSAPYAALLDPDGAPEPETIVRLVEALDDDPRIAAAAAHVRDFSDSTPVPSDESELEWAPGGATVYRRAALDDLQGFDELFAWYCEDMDFGYRARRAGWRLVRVGDTVFRHPTQGGRSFRRSARFTEYVLLWSHVHFGRRVALKAWLRQLALLTRTPGGGRMVAVAGGAIGLAAYLRHIPEAERRRR